MTLENLKEMRERIQNLHRFLRIEDRLIKIENDKQLSLSPGFWDDNARATGILKEIKINEFWVGLYNGVKSAVEDFAVLFDFWKEGEANEDEVKVSYDNAVKLIDELEFKSTLNEPEDEMPGVMVINSGAGGTESQDWAEMLLRMYRMYGEKQGWKVSEIDVQYGDGAGIKQATLEFDGAFAYGLLKAESGVHRLVRISPFDSNARRHTSFASVFVYPLIDDSIAIEVSPADLEWEFYRSGGKGGQNVNKVNSKVTLLFDVVKSAVLTEDEKHTILEKMSSRLTREGVLMLSSQESRSQIQNKEAVIEKFDLLMEKAFKRKKVRRATKPSKSPPRPSACWCSAAA